MKIAAHPLIVAVALGLLNPSALSEAGDGDTSAQRSSAKNKATATSSATIASLEAQQSDELESVLDELNRSIGARTLDS